MLYIALLAFPFLLLLSIKLYEFFKRSKVVHVHTGKVLQGTSIFNQFMLRGSSRLTNLLLENIEKYGEIYSSFFGPFLQVVVASPELAKKVLMDTTTFEKFNISFTRLNAKFFGNKNVVAANGEVWKNHRKPMNPAFVSSQNRLTMQ